MESHLILVVEDEDDARQILTQILELEGFRVVACSNGADALDYLLRAERPCLIVLDLLMPVMDGRQFGRALSQQALELRSIPIIVVSALDAPAAAGIGAIRTLKKPLDVDVLLSAVRELC
jgi:two-component system, chemotaxis family, chemotaxis protein CheY